MQTYHAVFQFLTKTSGRKLVAVQTLKFGFQVLGLRSVILPFRLDCLQGLGIAGAVENIILFQV